MIGYGLGLWRLGFWFYTIRRGRPILIVFTFHRVTDYDRSKHYYMYYEKGIDHKIFARQLEAIGKYFEIISLDEYIDIIEGRKAPGSHSALITFDDADSEFLKYALPYLTEHDYPSVMFTPTDFIDTPNRFWHLRVSNIVRRLTPKVWEAFQSQAELLPKSIKQLITQDYPLDESHKAALALALNHNLDRENIKEALTIIDGWEGIIGKEFVLGINCLSWEQLRLLGRYNVQIESHSASHGKLGQLGPEEIEKELTESKRELESRLGKEVRTISYPGGSFSADVIAMAPRTGYTLGFTTRSGFCDYPIQGEGRFKIPRYSLYGDTKPETHYVLGMLAIKGILGKRI